MLVHSCMQIKIIQFKKIIMFDDSLKDENKFYCFNRLLVPEDSNMEKTIFDNKKTIFNSTKRLICVGFEDNDYSSPIVLGYLKLSKTDGMKDAKRTHITTTSLSVKENVTLPTNTSFLAPNSTQQVLPFNELWELLQSKQ